MSSITRVGVWFRRRLRPAAPATHRETALLLQHYLDGRVEDSLARLVAQHIASCPDCTMEVEIYDALRESLREHGQPAPEVLGRLGAFADRLAAGDVDPSLLSDDAPEPS